MPSALTLTLLPGLRIPYLRSGTGLMNLSGTPVFLSLKISQDRMSSCSGRSRMWLVQLFWKKLPDHG